MKSWLRYLVRWLTRYQVLGLTALFALIVIGFEGVAGLGLPALFWCRDWYGLLFIGFAVATFFALCSFVGFLLDHGSLGFPPHPAALRHYFIRTIWLPTIVIAFRGLWRNLSPSSCERMEWVMLAGYGAGLVIDYFAARALTRVANPLASRRWFEKLVTRMMWKYRPNAPKSLWLHAYAVMVTAILAAIYLVFAVVIGFKDPWINAGVAITMLLGLIVLAYGALRFFVPHGRLLILFSALLWVALVNQIPLKHKFEELKGVTPVKLAGHEVRGTVRLVSDKTALNAWRAHLQETCGEARPKLIVLMTSGGGVRASVWTAAVLRELDREPPCGYVQHTRVIAGASGGMVGAGYWVTRRVFTDTSERCDESEDRAGCELRGVTADALDNVARYLVLRDVPALFLPFRIPDRGYALEKAWKKNAPRMEHDFQQLRSFEQSGVAPSLIYSPASLDDGRRVLVSNLDLDYMTRHAVDGHAATRSAFQFFDVFDDHELSVATGARMSASFPWVSSATELPTTQLRRVGDAGYFDNYGGFVISSWLAQNRQWLIDNTSGVLIVQVRDSPVGADNRTIASGPENNRAARAFSELTAPISGVASTRTKAMHFRTDFELAAVTPLFGRCFVEAVEIELPKGLAPLSWNLTRKAAKDIIDYAPKEVSAKMKTIEAWWASDPEADPAARTTATPQNQNATTPTAADRSRAASSPL